MRITPPLMMLSLGDAAADAATTTTTEEPVTGGPAIEGPPIAEVSFADGLNAWRSPGDAFTKVQNVFSTNNEYRGVYLAGLLAAPLAVLFLLMKRK